MKLIQFLRGGNVALGLGHQGVIVDLADVVKAEKLSPLPNRTEHLLWELETFEPKLREIDKKLKAGAYQEMGLSYPELQVLPPLEKPNSTRDAYAFRQHVLTARRNRGLEMIPEFDQFPVFYFTNHNSIYGPGPVPLMADHFDKLDFELEVGIVVGKRGRNLRAEEADRYIFGYTILNDLSARTLQMEEMKLSLGPAKGKDFANCIGPFLVTTDELEGHRVTPPSGHVGNAFSLEMRASINGKLFSEGNMASMDWTFAEILERVSYGADIFPTDLIGSGTVGTGCLLELNGTAKLQNPSYEPVWLQPGDEVTLEIEELGRLTNLMTLEDEFSILARVHNA